MRTYNHWVYLGAYQGPGDNKGWHIRQVKGVPVHFPGYEPLEFFIYEVQPPTEYVAFQVCEKQTGRAIANGMDPEEAYFKAQASLKSQPKEYWLQLFDRLLHTTGWWGGPHPPINNPRKSGESKSTHSITIRLPMDVWAKIEAAAKRSGRYSERQVIQNRLTYDYRREHGVKKNPSDFDPAIYGKWQTVIDEPFPGGRHASYVRQHAEIELRKRYPFSKTSLVQYHGRGQSWEVEAYTWAHGIFPVMGGERVPTKGEPGLQLFRRTEPAASEWEARRKAEELKKALVRQFEHITLDSPVVSNRSQNR